MKTVSKSVFFVVAFSFCFVFSFSQTIERKPISLCDNPCNYTAINDPNLRKACKDICENGWIKIIDKSESSFVRSAQQYDLLVEVITGPIVQKDQLNVTAKIAGYFPVALYNIGGDFWRGTLTTPILYTLNCHATFTISYHVTGLAKSSFSNYTIPIDEDKAVSKELTGFGTLEFVGLTYEMGYYYIMNEDWYDLPNDYRQGTITLSNYFVDRPFTLYGYEVYTQDEGQWVPTNDTSRVKIVEKLQLPLALQCGESAIIKVAYKDVGTPGILLIINDLYFLPLFRKPPVVGK